MNVITLVLILLILLLVIWIFKRVPILKTLIFTLACVGIVGFAGYSAIELYKYKNTSGGIFGNISGNFETNNVAVNNLDFSLTEFEFTQEYGDTYSAFLSLPEKFELESNKTYGMYLNDNPCNNVKSDSNFITSNFKYNFYDDDFELICSDSLSFKFAFYTNYASLKISTSGGATVVRYWYSYFEKENATLSIKPATYYSNSFDKTEGETPSGYCFLTTDVDGEQTVSLVTKGTRISEIPSVSKDLYVFEGWSTDKTTVLDSETTIESDLTVYAQFKFYKQWETMTWIGLEEFEAENTWTDGENVYLMQGYTDTNSYILDVDSHSWSQLTWLYKKTSYDTSTLTPTTVSLYGKYVWTDGENYYYSQNSTQYILNVQDHTVSKTAWNGCKSFEAKYTWTDGENYYLSISADKQYILSDTLTWENVYWNISDFKLYGYEVWTDGENIYADGHMDSIFEYFVFDKETKTWSSAGLDKYLSDCGKTIWTDGQTTFGYEGLSYTAFYLDPASNSAVELSSDWWRGKMDIGFDKENIWTDRVNYYYSKKVSDSGEYIHLVLKEIKI